MKQYQWDEASMKMLTDIFEEYRKRIEELQTRLDKLEKEPKVINNYYTQSPPYPQPYTPSYPQPNPIWCETTACKT